MQTTRLITELRNSRFISAEDFLYLHCNTVAGPISKKEVDVLISNFELGHSRSAVEEARAC